MKVDLSNVTIIVIDNVAQDLVFMALRDTLAVVDPGAVFVWTDAPPAFKSLGVDILPFSGTSIREVNNTLWKEVPKFVKTSHYLWLQWDSWVIAPDAWDNSFLEYDYIGAPWWFRDNRNVGNGGFSLRSTRLGKRLRSANLFPGQDEDKLICRNWRGNLEEEGFVFAPEDLAYKFSRECTGWERTVPSFGFHGIFNWPKVLSVPGIGERLRYVNPYVLSHKGYREMLSVMISQCV